MKLVGTKVTQAACVGSVLISCGGETCCEKRGNVSVGLCIVAREGGLWWLGGKRSC